MTAQAARTPRATRAEPAARAALDRRAAIQDDRVACLDRMLEVRRFEDRVQALFAEGAVHGTTHLANGQEAVALAVARAVRPTDHVTCTYRGHGVALALGMALESVLGEIMGRQIGCIGGVGGSMHLSDPAVGLLPTFAIVGAGIPVAAGAALSAQVLGEDRVAVAVFGDGATNIGAFHESLNLASVWRLPVVFVCENNHFGEYSRIDVTTPLEDLASRAAAYAMPSLTLDGQDLDAATTGLRDAVAAARAGDGPHLVELKTYRYSGHSRADTAPYRDEAEYKRWLARDPITILRSRLVQEGHLSDLQATAMDDAVDARIEAAVETVQQSPPPGPDAMFAHVHAVPNRAPSKAQT